MNDYKDLGEEKKDSPRISSLSALPISQLLEERKQLIKLRTIYQTYLQEIERKLQKIENYLKNDN